MAAGFTAKLELWIQKREFNRYAQNKNGVDFLSLQEEISAAIHEGRSVRAIWVQLQNQGKIAYAYSTFLKYVRRHIKAA